MIGTRTSLRARSVAVVAAAVLLLSAVPAVAAPGGDALIETSTFIVAAGDSPAKSAVVMCPSGTRATGGGAAPVDPEAQDFYRIQVSGPVDGTGAVINTDTGDVPRGWAVAVSHFLTSVDVRFKAFALCSRTSDVVVQAAPAQETDHYFGAPECPNGTRAVGGGAGSLTTIEDGVQAYVTLSSHPVDASGTAAGTVNGDVAVAWSTRVLTNSGSPGAPRLFSLCSDESDATVRARSFTLAPEEVGGADVACPSGTRALAGGLVSAEEVQTSDRIEYSAPLDGTASLAGTRDGDIARRWLSAARNATDVDRTFRVMALCGESEPRPDALIKRATDSAYVGQNVYSPTPQLRRWSAMRGQTRSFNLVFENDGEDDTFTIRGCATRRAASATYINPKTGANVTTKVTGPGYVTSLPHGARRSLVLRLKPTASATIGSSIRCRVTVTSALDSGIVDAVIAEIRVIDG